MHGNFQAVSRRRRESSENPHNNINNYESRLTGQKSVEAVTIVPQDLARWTLLALRWSLTIIYLLQKHSSQLAQHSDRLRPQHFGSETSRNTSGPPKPWEMDPHARCRRMRALLIQAALWAPSVNEKDAILEAMRELLDLEDPPSARWPGSDSGYNNADFQLSPTQPVARRPKPAATALCPTSASEVATTARIGRYCGIGVSQIKHLLPSFHLAVISLMHPATESSPLSLETLAPHSHAQHGGGQRQPNRRMVSTRAVAFSPICCENSCRDSEGRLQLVDSLLETGVKRRKRSSSPVEKGNRSLPTRTGPAEFEPVRFAGLCAKEDERRRNDTYTRDAVLTAETIGDPTEHDQAGFDRDQINGASNGSSFSQPGLLPPRRRISPRTRARCTSQGKYWPELQKLRHRKQQIIVQTRDPTWKLPDRAPIAALEQL